MNKFMIEAIQEAYTGITKGEGGPFGSVIVLNGIIIAKAHNQVLKYNDPTCHGEIQAIRQACKTLNTFDLTDCKIYTTAEPCPMCLGAIIWSNISKVYYGCDINDTEEIGFRDKKFYNYKKDKEFITQIDRSECKELYNVYLNIKDKISY